VAVTTTAQDILTGALARSLKNSPDRLATNATELLQLVIRSMRGLYAFAARVNPTYFAESAVVAFAAGGWARPELAESVFRIENPTPTEVVVVPFDDRKAEPSRPAVYRLGGKFITAGNALDPVAGNLTFFYARRPTSPANLTPATLDAQWTEQFNELLMLEVAIYLAIKDGRAEEVGSLTADRDKWAQLFVAYLEHETVNEVRRFGHVWRFNTQSMVPIMSLLAGPAKAAA
jgi:hypothetical protein